MASADAELERLLKETGKQLLLPHDSVDELLHVLDKVEKLLLRVDQSPKRSMLDALKPSMNALIKDSLSKHSDIDVKVAVASCISEITRITAPDAPYTDDQMRDVFELIVSSFEDLSDRSSRSYNKRASILETVSKVRSCVIMLDLECDELIVKMFDHFLKAVRDFHIDSVFSSMENIMELVIDESEEISVEMLKPLLASVKKDREGVLPVAHKLAKGVLLKSAEKLKPYMMPALTSLGESLDAYHKIVAAVCDGTTANIENKDDDDEPANECKLEKGSVDEAQQADESKLTTASSDHVDQVVKSETCPKEEVDPTVENKSPKSVMSNGVNETVKEEASVDQESKKLEEEKTQESINKEDIDDSHAGKLVKEKSQTEKIADKSETEADSSHIEGEKEIEKDNDVKELENEKENDVKEPEKEKEKEKDNDVKESENEKDSDVKEVEKEKDNDVKESENEKDNDVQESEDQNEKDNDIKESEDQNEKDNDVKESEDQNEKDNDVKESENEAAIPPETEKDKDAVQEDSPKAVESNSVPDESSVRSETKPVPQEVEAASPSKSGPAPDETHVKKTPEAQKQAGNKTATAKEVKRADTVNKSEDGEASSDSDAKPLKKSESKSKSTKQSGKRSKQSGKKSDVGQSDTKKPKPSGKDVDVKGDESDSDSDNKPLKLSAKKSTLKKKDNGNKRGNGKNVAEKDQANSVSGDDEMDISPKSTTKSVTRDKRKIAVEEEEDDSDDKPLKPSAKSSSKKKDDGKKRKDQAKSLSGNDEMDVSPKSAPKSMTETPVTSAKRKRSTGKDEVSNAIKYDESLIGTKVKVWWPEDKMYYEGVVTEFYPAKKKHKVSYVDGDEEKLNMRTQKWEIVKEFTLRNDEEPNTEVQSDEGSPEMHKKKKSKTDPAEKIKDSAKKAGSVSSSGKSKGSTSKDNKSAQKTSGKSSDKEDEETLKTSSKTKTVNKSKGKTPPSSSKSNTAKSNAKEPEDVKSTENTKSGSNKRKKRT